MMAAHMDPLDIDGSSCRSERIVARLCGREARGGRSLPDPPS